MAGTTIACKNHGSEYLEDAKAVILIMRNPYDSFKVRVKLISSEFEEFNYYLYYFFILGGIQQKTDGEKC